MSSPPARFEPTGDLGRLELKVPLRSEDEWLALVLTVLIGTIGIALLAGTQVLSVDVLRFLFIGALPLVVIVPQLPWLHRRSVLEVCVDHRRLTLLARPVGSEVVVALEDVEAVHRVGRQLVVRTVRGERHRYTLGRVSEREAEWLEELLRTRAEARRREMEGQAPDQLVRLAQRRQTDDRG